MKITLDVPTPQLYNHWRMRSGLYVRPGMNLDMANDLQNVLDALRGQEIIVKNFQVDVDTPYELNDQHGKFEIFSLGDVSNGPPPKGLDIALTINPNHFPRETTFDISDGVEMNTTVYDLEDHEMLLAHDADGRLARHADRPSTLSGLHEGKYDDTLRGINIQKPMKIDCVYKGQDFDTPGMIQKCTPHGEHVHVLIQTSTIPPQSVLPVPITASEILPHGWSGTLHLKIHDDTRTFHLMSDMKHVKINTTILPQVKILHM